MAPDSLLISILKVLGDKNPQMTLGSTGAEGDWPYQGTIEVRFVFGSVCSAVIYLRSTDCYRVRRKYGGEECPHEISQIEKCNKKELPCFEILSHSQFDNPLPDIPLIEITYPSDGSKDRLILGKHELGNNVLGQSVLGQR